LPSSLPAAASAWNAGRSAGGESFGVFTPGDYNVPALETLFDQVIAWSPLAGLRA
jgi:hypothetical protein